MLRPRGGYRGWLVELAGVGGAVALGVLALAHLAASPRSWVLFYDGDSLLFPLVSGSIRVGQAQDWVLSSPLFLPEAVAYLPVGAVGLPVQASLLIDGVVNWIVMYAVLRAVGGAVVVSRAGRVCAGLVVLGVVSGFAVCEGSASRDALEPASLLLTTTYYSGTVVAVIAAVALVARALRGPVRWRAVLGLAAVAAVSVMSNPLFVAWAVVPLVVVTVGAVFVGASRRGAAAVVGSLAGGSFVGVAARIPFRSVLVQDDGAKIRPDLASTSLGYYGSLLGDRLSSVPGTVEVVLVGVMLALAAVALVVSVRRRWVVGVVLAGVAVVGPVLVVAGSIALGTFAARYLEPVVFLSPIGLLTLAPFFSRHAGVGAGVRALRSPVVRTGAGVLAGSVILSGTAALAVSSRTDPDVACATGWVATHDEFGAGQYWTVRAIKAYSPDPRRLIQTDADGQPYVWLSNAADLDQRSVSYTVTDDASVPFGSAFANPVSQVRCGRYTINQYAAPIPLGQPHH